MDVVEPVQILLVEDNDDDVVLVKEAFEAARVLNVVEVAYDGDEALRNLRDHASARPHLVLLDINMPKCNGFEVLDAMKADPAMRSIPVVMLTTSASEDDVVRSYAGGACSYIRKPVTVEGLRRIAEQFALYWTLVARLPQRGAK